MTALFDALDAWPWWKFYGALAVAMALIVVADRILARRWAR